MLVFQSVFLRYWYLPSVFTADTVTTAPAVSSASTVTGAMSSDLPATCGSIAGEIADELPGEEILQAFLKRKFFVAKNTIVH
jgi:hypothetical protein